jgi:hypothetical protein
LIGKRDAVPGEGAEHSGYCHWAVDGKRVIGSTPLPFLRIEEKKATTSCRRFKDFKSFKGFRRAQSHAGTGFQDLMVYRYGAFGVQLWEIMEN